eukprot:TRINITY_DN2619_c0_g1_i1.p1 TRINITY_DN2619_c0_g1~~TRINITY_DN2619_c0_g1_i1.p1  ORF type:complete len:1056 (+),score=253.65 TRINITY_DN2619_c0_g1_i1:97-3264(+)
MLIPGEAASSCETDRTPSRGASRAPIAEPPEVDKSADDSGGVGVAVKQEVQQQAPDPTPTFPFPLHPGMFLVAAVLSASAGVGLPWGAGRFALWTLALAAAACCGAAALAGLRPSVVALTPLCVLCLLAADVTQAQRLRSRYVFLAAAAAAWAARAAPAVLLPCSVLIAVYAAAERVEAAAPYGLSWLDWQLEDRAAVTGVCNCGEPPCALDPGAAVHDALVCAATLTAVLLSKREAPPASPEQAALLQFAGEVAQQVAYLQGLGMSEEAHATIQGSAGLLPRTLTDALHDLVHRVSEFMPDVDGSLYSSGTASSPSSRQRAVPPPPGISDPDKVLCMCFTDVQSSTALWEAAPRGMQAGLKIHNNTLREVAEQCTGYEVKTIGDAFMLAFTSAVDACRFALLSQERLLEREWPAELTEHPLCQPRAGSDGNLLWHGLRVRIGLHCGTARAELNELTGRFDFFGTTVNIAARVEGAVKRGGLNGVTAAVLAELGADGLAQLGNPVVDSLGPRELKGIKEPVSLSTLMPERLAARSDSAGSLLSERLSATGGTPRPFVSPTATAAPVVPVLLSTTREEFCPAFPSTQTPLRSPFHTPFITQAMHDAISVQNSNNPRLPGQPDREVRPSTTSHTRRMPSGSCLLAGPLGQSLGMSAGPSFRVGKQNISARTARRRATVITARVELSCIEHFDELHCFVSAMETTAESTKGLIECCLSSFSVVTWNGTRSCPEHTASAMLFLDTAPTACAAPVKSHFGAASGELLLGMVTAQRRRFPTVVGTAVYLSMALAEESEVCGDLAMAVGDVAERLAHAGRAFRAAMWQSQGEPPFTVWEVTRRAPLAEADAEDEEDKWGAVLSLAPLQLGGEDEGSAGGPLGGAEFADLFERIAAGEDCLLELDAMAGKGNEHAARLRARVSRNACRSRLVIRSMGLRVPASVGSSSAVLPRAASPLAIGPRSWGGAKRHWDDDSIPSGPTSSLPRLSTDENVTSTMDTHRTSARHSSGLVRSVQTASVAPIIFPAPLPSSPERRDSNERTLPALSGLSRDHPRLLSFPGEV